MRDKLRSRPLESGVDRDALVSLGLHYLKEAEGVDAATPAAAGAVDGAGE